MLTAYVLLKQHIKFKNLNEDNLTVLYQIVNIS